MEIDSSKRDVVRSGGVGIANTSARAGYLPIALERVPLDALAGLSIYLRRGERGALSADAFNLYCSANFRFTGKHRDRLLAHGVKFVFITEAQQNRFNRQIEASLTNLVSDSTIETSVKAELIYETAVELMNELLGRPDLAAMGERIGNVSRAVASLVLEDASAFAHLFAASHHDFYTATHMVNVATWMVPMALALGHDDPDELNHICQAGLLHDIGKTRISPELFNRRGELSDADWATIRQHPELGARYLQEFENLPALVEVVALQHHERLDGSGYPHKLKGDQIHTVSKICAVVDSFDAMTAFRPFKEHTMPVAKALRMIMKETPQKYDSAIVECWIDLLESAEREGLLSEPLTTMDGINQRQFPRFPIQCSADVFILGEGFNPNQRPLSVIAHSLSRSGGGFVARKLIPPGERIRLRLRGSGMLHREHEGLVVRCRAYADGNYEIGLKFSKLAEREMEQQLAATA
ncbi:MAG TPA: HD domain-containing phosphohydrolase [Tepidisphaeraceae bacterium]|nr:HD domain-containing phosphohydrolase [Tepidisphaeraceae bacterium]